MTGTTRPAAGRPDQHRLSAPAMLRNRPIAARRWWRPERSGAQKKHPRDASNRVSASVGQTVVILLPGGTNVMSRQRARSPATSYHVTMRCNNQALDLRWPRSRKAILFCLAKAGGRLDLVLFGICVM